MSVALPVFFSLPVSFSFSLFRLLFLCGQPLGLGRGWCVPGGVGSQLCCAALFFIDSLGHALGELVLCVLILPGLVVLFGSLRPLCCELLINESTSYEL